MFGGAAPIKFLRRANLPACAHDGSSRCRNQRALGIFPVPLQRPHGSLPEVLPLPLHCGQFSHSALRSAPGRFGIFSRLIAALLVAVKT
jgi:hypothetical protein